MQQVSIECLLTYVVYWYMCINKTNLSHPWRPWIHNAFIPLFIMLYDAYTEWSRK